METKKVLLLGIFLTLSTLFVKNTGRGIINTSESVTIKKESVKLVEESFLTMLSSKKNIKKEETPIGYLKIEKIGLKEKLYDIESPKNNIQTNLEILPLSSFPSKEGSNLMIVGHSGYGPLAYFKHLNQIKENDEIKIVLDKTYIYNVRKKELVNKSRTTYFKTKENILTLFTCSSSDNSKFLKIEALLKE